MSRDYSIADLRRSTREWTGRAAPTTIASWTISLPGTDLEERPRRRVAPPPKRRIRRGRIQLVAA
jgi:hypothetical protein